MRRDYDVAQGLSARLAQTGSQAESGEALRIRVAAQTANIGTIADAAAAGLQELLRIAARWLGANPEEVVVEPNKNFADDPLPFTELQEMLTFKQRGGVISHRTMNEVMVNRDITTRTLEEEIEEIEEEEALIPEAIADMAAMASMGAAGAPFEDPNDNPGNNGNDGGENDDDDDET